MSAQRDELRRLEDHLAALEAAHDFEAGGESPEIEALIGRIAELSAELDADEDRMLEAMAPERRVSRFPTIYKPAPTEAERQAADARERALASKQRRRDEQLRREWERWRYQRAKLPPAQRGPMLKIGERECRYCGAVFVVDHLRRRFCPGTNRRQLHHKARTKPAGVGSLT